MVFAERDTNGDVLWGWMYPAVEDSLKAVIVSKVRCLTVFGDELPHRVPSQFERRRLRMHLRRRPTQYAL